MGKLGLGWDKQISSDQFEGHSLPQNRKKYMEICSCLYEMYSFNCFTIFFSGNAMASMKQVLKKCFENTECH